MVKIENPLALHLLTRPGPWTDARRLDTIATVFLLLTEEVALLRSAFAGLEEQRFKVDSELLSGLYAASSREFRLKLSETTAFFRLDPETFKPMFLDLWKGAPLKPAQRQSLLVTLRRFLAWHPDQGGGYQEVLLAGLQERSPALLLVGFSLAGYLNDIPMKGLLRLKRGMESSEEGLRMHSSNALCMLVKRRREVSPAVAAFCRSPEVLATARRLRRSDPSKDVRLCAYYLLKALREADPGHRRRIPA